MRSVGLCVMVVVAGCAGDPAEGGEEPAETRAAPAALAHSRCGWIGAQERAIGVATFVPNAAFFDAVHPMWYELGADSVSVTTLRGANDPEVIAAADASGVQLIPMVAGVEKGAVNLRGMIHDPAKRSAHVDNLVALAVDNGYAGLDIDYEKLWRAEDRPGYEAFIAELSAKMHDAGLQVSIAIPSFTAPNPSSAYEYAFLASQVDHIHLMGYDFHTLGTHEGPLAPLGWIEAVAAYAATTGDAEKFILGVPNYGVTPTRFRNSAASAAACGGGYATADGHMTSCRMASWKAGRAPHCDLDGERLSFEDTLSLEEKVAAAKAAGLGGVTYWTIGGEPPGFFEMVRRHFP
jgi:spore germination protein YaaH